MTACHPPRWACVLLLACTALASLSGCGRKRTAFKILKGYSVAGPLSWSPDGTSLALSITKGRYANGWAFLLSPGHRKVTRIGPDLSYYVAVQFVPDGRRVVLMPDRPEQDELAVRDLTSGKSRVLYHAPSGKRVTGAVLSPDGNWCAVTLSQGQPETAEFLQIVNVATGASTKLWGGAAALVQHAAFSPDSKRLLWWGPLLPGKNAERASVHYYLSDAPFRHCRALPAAPLSGLSVSRGCWTPDSRRFVARSDSATNLDLQAVDATTGATQTILEQKDWVVPYWSGCAWSPDGRWIAYGAAGTAAGQPDQRLCLVSPDGKRSATIADRTGTQHLFGSLAWSPDGHRLAYVEGQRIVVTTVP